MKELFKKYIRNECSPEELNLLLKQFEFEENKEVLGNLITQQLEADEDLTAINEEERENILAHSYSNIRSQIFLKINLRLSCLGICNLCWFSDDCKSFFSIT
jgi:hypothetical protein